MITNIEDLRARIMALMEITRTAYDPSKEPIDMQRGLGCAFAVQATEGIAAVPSNPKMMSGWNLVEIAKSIAAATGVPTTRAYYSHPMSTFDNFFWESRIVPDRMDFARTHNITCDWLTALEEVERYIQTVAEHSFDKIFPGWLELCGPFCTAAPSLVGEQLLLVRGRTDPQGFDMHELTESSPLLQHYPFVARMRSKPDEVVILVP